MIIAASLTNLYWLSFFFVGLAAYGILSRKANKAFKLDFIELSIISFLFGWIAILPVVVLGYLFGMPVSWVAISWLVLLLMALIWLAKNLEFAFQDILKPSFKLKSSWLFFLFAAVLLFDFILSLKVGGLLSLGTDAWVHLAKINHLLNNGMNINDPYFSQLIDARYHVSLTHPIYAAGSYLTGLTPVIFWKFSLGIFRFLVFLSIYLSAKLVSKSQSIAYLTAATSVFVASFSLRFALYPNVLALVWYILFIFGAVRVLDNPRDKLARVLLLSTSLAISFIHPGYSLGLFVMALFIVVVSLLMNGHKWDWGKYKWLIWPALIASWSPLVSFFLPNNMTEEARLLGEESYEFITVFGTRFLSPLDGYTWLSILSMLVIAIYVWRKCGKKSGLSIVVISAFVLFPLIAYNPVVFPLLNELTPTWFIRRLRFTNFLDLALLAGLAAFILAPYVREKIKSVSGVKLPEHLLAVIALILIAVPSIPNVKRFYNQRHDNDRAQNYVESLDDVLPKSDERVTIVAPESVSYYIPGVANAEVINIDSTHAPPAANYELRASCLGQLLSDDDFVRRSAINAINPRYYILWGNYKETLEGNMELIDNKMQKDSAFTLFNVALVNGAGLGESFECNQITVGNA